LVSWSKVTSPARERLISRDTKIKHTKGESTMKKVLALMAVLVIGLSAQALAGNYYPWNHESRELGSLRQEAIQGDAMSQCILASVYFVGEELPQDYELALYWYSRSAKQGNPVAQAMTGYMYLSGNGVQVDYDTAYSWTTLSVDQNLGFAQFMLGVMYDNGYGVPMNYTLAAYWYKQAAEQGVVEAQLSLAEMYEYGDGVGRDYVEALKWYSLAAGLCGDETSDTYIDCYDGAKRILSELSPEAGAEALNKAMKRSEEWLQMYQIKYGSLNNNAIF
jgi:hypothetical protein